ncbi:citrate (Si)-synthase [Rhabdochlamydiaceae symbiont of Dictyostelium giganteum]|uniref:citrate (Si)-synthase n=1 Tax=Rhabdochlamydiaceae symbiont of Dictyostelium giganteum TaxID=3342349 RepID=UPI00384F7BB9
MDEGVLFQIKKEHLETGLRGFPVGYCPTSTVTSTEGLFYANFPIKEVASWSAEEGIYLILKGKKGSQEEVNSYFSKRYRASYLKPQTLEAIRQLPFQGSPMKLLGLALLIAGIFESIGEYQKDCEHLVMIIPEITALVINLHAGWKHTPSCPELGYIQNFIHMLGVPQQTREMEEAMRLFNVLHYDHGGGNLSTFVGKAVASSLEDLYGSIASAMCALAGPRHGRANQDALEFLQKIFIETKGDITAQKIEELMRQKIRQHELIFGFGHAVLRIEDPRSTVMYDYLEKHFQNHPLVQTAFLLRSVGVRVLQENPKIASPYPNVDAVSGVMLAAANFNYPLYFPLLFGMSRTVGIARQIVYERVEAREGRGTPIIRPRYLYNGPS